MTFITFQGLYSYKVMPFDLKNLGATYQRVVNHIFNKQIGRDMELNPMKLLRLQDEVESNEVWLWCILLNIPWVYGLTMGNKS